MIGGGGNEPTSFSNMPQIIRVSRDEESYYTAEGYFINNYKGEYLREGERLNIYFSRNPGVVHINAEKQLNEFIMVFRYVYDIKVWYADSAKNILQTYRKSL